MSRMIGSARLQRMRAGLARDEIMYNEKLLERKEAAAKQEQ